MELNLTAAEREEEHYKFTRISLRPASPSVGETVSASRRARIAEAHCINGRAHLGKGSDEDGASDWWRSIQRH